MNNWQEWYVSMIEDSLESIRFLASDISLMTSLVEEFGFSEIGQRAQFILTIDQTDIEKERLWLKEFRRWWRENKGLFGV